MTTERRIRTVAGRRWTSSAWTVNNRVDYRGSHVGVLAGDVLAGR